MTRITRFTVVLVVGASFSPSSDLRAQDASFGCKVLLCAAASAPGGAGQGPRQAQPVGVAGGGWTGIPYCVPVMQSLFRQLAHGGSWPICSEGNAGSIGYDPYLPCPAGTVPMSASMNAGQGLVSSSDGNLCADPSRPEQVCSGRFGTCSTSYPTVLRPTRSDPNYVDITTADGVQRFYFSLQGY